MRCENFEKCRNILENSKSVFNKLDNEGKELLEDNITCIIYKKNEIIFAEGDEPAGLLFLAEGKVKIYKEGVGGREQIIRLASSPGFIGYRAFFAEEYHTASASAIEESVTCLVSRKIMLKLLHSNAEFSLSIIKSFATELGLSYNRTVTLTQKHIRGRLAESLIFLKDTYGYETDNATLKIYLSREDIANLSNMTTSNAIRTLSSFAGEGLVELNGRKIKILDVFRLQKVSELG